MLKHLPNCGAGKQRTSSRSWSEEEERLFQEALALHGRDWKKCAEHVGTRDPRWAVISIFLRGLTLV